MQFKTVGAFEAKTHLPALLDTVEQGEKVVITRRGLPVAVLIPYREEKRAIKETIESLLAFRKGITLKGLSVKEMKEERRL
jgi:prevent-host-death family protein